MFYVGRLGVESSVHRQLPLGTTWATAFTCPSFQAYFEKH